MGSPISRCGNSDEILSLNRSGQLVSQYPRVKELLADMPHAELMRAGQLLARLNPDEVASKHPGLVSVKIAITGHGTLSAMVPALTAELARHGILLRPYMSAFDQYLFDLSDPGSSLYANAPDLTLCVLDPAIVFDEAPMPWRPADVECILADKVTVIERLTATFETAGRGTLVFNTMPLPTYFTAQIIDHRSRAQLGRIWHEASARLLRLADDHRAVVVVDVDPLLAEGIPAIDARLSVYAGAHLSPSLLERYSREIAHLARHVAGRTKKVLLVDLDGTMWGGVLGDDGIDGIDIGDGLRGTAFRDFQKAVRQIGSQGVLLGIVSKNNIEPVREALRRHPQMVVSEDDFVRVVANWQPKHENLSDLASALNLGLDSFVFVDDSSFECGLMRSQLRDVTVLQLDDEPAFHVEKLLRDGWFDSKELTAADQTRVTNYRDQLARDDFRHEFDTIEAYLRELKLKIRLTSALRSEVPRISQITMRTSQFNFTTQRLQQPDVQRLLDDPGARVLAIHASDRFGDHGLVGVIFTRQVGDVVHIDNFLLSCRVFSRGIEQACLAAILRQARDDGAQRVTAEYRETSRNRIVREFYLQHGFAIASQSDAPATAFQHDLGEITSVPGHIEFVQNFEGHAICKASVTSSNLYRMNLGWL